ncbi:NAD(P)H-dependent oxidoreductase [Arthrobacter sp. NPDC089319]|uniref:NADPH-dependent FMN reductase n=1 Tax=Arthrobacter sp. NPDC089319 TaxID=3155915 RepID=UPI003446E972
MSWFKNLFSKSSARRSAANPAPAAAEPQENATVSAAASTAPVASAPAAVVAGLPKIAIITGSTRPGRVNDSVAAWVAAELAGRTDATFEVVDIADFNLPLLDEAYPAAYQNYQGDHTKAWSAKIAEFDGYVFVANEYNHTVSSALANALSYLNAEFNNKAAGIVSYGSMGGVRAAEHLRNLLAELQVAVVRNQVMFSLFTDFENFADFKPTEQNAGTLAPMIDQLIPWAQGFATIRTPQAAAV